MSVLILSSSQIQLSFKSTLDYDKMFQISMTVNITSEIDFIDSIMKGLWFAFSKPLPRVLY